MLKNQDIICISSIDWDFIWQGHQEIMSTLAANGNRVIFIENTGVRSPGIRDISRLKSRLKNYFKGVKGIRKESDNLYIYSPLVMPFPYLWIARKINRFLILSVLKKWMKILDFSDPIIWTFLPTGVTLDIIDNVDNCLVVYYCIDNFSASSVSAKKIRATEKRLLKRADLVFVTSKALYDYCTEVSKNVSIFPFGVSLDNFEKVRRAATKIPEDLKDINKPIIGYVGGIHKWIDFTLIKKVALSCPEMSFVFVGPLQTDISILNGIKNIYFLGNKNHKDLPLYVKYFSVSIIPYLINDYTRNVYPTKLNEYLSMGKPVVSTNLPEILMFNQRYDNQVYIAKTADEFKDYLIKAVNYNSDTAGLARIKIAQENSWAKRIELMSEAIKIEIDKKRGALDQRWKETFISLFRKARNKTIEISLIALFIYAVIFYTPLMWLIAEPLKIAQDPVKADCIVVFAGGVGESGKPGQGYEERVQRAADLYRQGFSKHIIFSSGYTYLFKEPYIMKALAVSLGVPEGAIILEDKAKNTYENVLFSKELLLKNNWKRVLLVSSPYHMRRASLVFDKVAKEIKVIYVPVDQSLFYLREHSAELFMKQVNLQQMKSILHEYLGIVYYRFKGLI